MIAPLPMVLAGLAGFPGLRAARLPRVASFGLSWRPLCGLRLSACGSSRLCDRLPGVCALPRPFWLLRCVCGSLRLSFLHSSAWGSSLPPLRFGKELNRKLLVCARPALGDKKCKDRNSLWGSLLNNIKPNFGRAGVRRPTFGRVLFALLCFAFVVGVFAPSDRAHTGVAFDTVVPKFGRCVLCESMRQLKLEPHHHRVDVCGCDLRRPS